MKLENEVSIVRYKASTSVLRFWCLLSGHPTIGQALGAESTKKKYYGLRLYGVDVPSVCSSHSI